MFFESFKWATAVLSLVGVVLNIHRKRACFLVWAFTNSAWTAIDVYHGVWAQAALQAVYVGLAIYGLRKWRVA
jgi:hypothetical protein